MAVSLHVSLFVSGSSGSAQTLLRTRSGLTQTGPGLSKVSKHTWTVHVHTATLQFDAIAFVVLFEEPRVL